jgi:lipoprotein-anchoring transpeptidase ErfK/SrfK
MHRTFTLFLFALLGLVTIAQAGPLAQTSGNPAIDSRWALVGNRQTPIDPATAPTRGIFRAIFGPGRPAAVAQPRTTTRQAVVPTHRSRTIDRAYLPAVVNYDTVQRPGTIVIDTRQRYLYLVLEDGKAQRYGVGVGREGFGWSGTVRIGRKAEWPRWTPPAAMRKRQPYLPASMEGGPSNPLGARAMYLYDGGRDTLFRIHGSNEPWTIGHAVSSGCFRMRNEDVIELYSRVGVGTKVVVI